MPEQQSLTQPPDLLTYLRDAYATDPQSPAGEYDEGTDLGAVDRFIEWARPFMRQNQPVGLDFMTVGVGLRLQDATVVPYVSAPAEQPSDVGHDSGVQVTRPAEASLRRGIVPDRSFGITGAKG